MRTFSHTHELRSDKLVRVWPNRQVVRTACTFANQEEVASINKFEKQSAYSMRSKLETMKDNLRDGAIYVRKQAENLRSIDHTVSLLRNEYLKVMNSNTNPKPGQRPEILLHHQALNSLTSGTFYGHPLRIWLRKPNPNPS